MRNFLFITMCIFLIFSFNLLSAKIYQEFSSDEEDICSYINKKKTSINNILINYEISGEKYYIGFDYHVGYISGKYDAYNEILWKLEKFIASD